MLHEVAPALAHIRATSVARYLSSSIHIQEKPDENPSFQLVKDGGALQVALDRKLVGAASYSIEENESRDPHQFNSDSKVQLLQLPGLWYLSQSTEIKHSVSRKSDNSTDVNPENVVALAREALSASIEAASLSEHCKLFDSSTDASLSSNLLSTSLTDIQLEEGKKVSSTRLRQRRSIKRRAPKHNIDVEDMKPLARPNLRRKVNEIFDHNDPLRPFLSGPDTKLLTLTEESDLIVKIQDFRKLVEVKCRLQNQFEREPTLVEWADAVGISCRVLRTQLHSGRRSREKLIHANYRMVVHIAKQYQGRGLSLQDMLQEGSMGLMKSIEKFKPQAGCRFATYAYWWIRQAVRKAIFHHSRTIRLPDNVYGLLSKIKEAKRQCIQKGIRYPSKEDVASEAGITVEKLESLLLTARMPVSMQQTVWTDQKTTFQEVTADMSMEAPELSVSKHLMRFHMRKLLSILNPKERKIIRLRFGIEDGVQKSLSEIGTVFGLSKERVRQLESRALYKLKQQCLNSQGLKAYENFLF
ncbi:OLC1v1034519C2 [Oldenlandia corymbosa var. corymbosa]|nr:OLC1v1034519C2 [Oldenlandia corymbosa var. corymbosa]